MKALTSLYAQHAATLSLGYLQALEAHGFETVVIHSGRAKKRSEVDDQYFALRALPQFQHWVALDEPDAFLVLRAGTKPRLLWPKADSFWERPRTPALEHIEDHVEIQRFSASGPDAIRTTIQSAVKGPTALIVEDARIFADWDFATPNPASLVLAFDELRVHKTAYEVFCIREANAAAARGHHAVLHAFRSGVHSELDLHLIYLQATAQDDPDTPYKNIVALGENAATLHHVSYGRNKVDASSLLLDAGATVHGYCSDITRTWVKGDGTTATTFRGLVTGLDALQLRLCALAGDGTMYQDLHDTAHRELAALLRDADVVRASVNEIDETGISRVFLPHGLGHSIGLQCHDVGCALEKPKQNNPALRHTRKIDQGQVFTIEPGLYFIESLLEKLRTEAHGSAVNWKLVDALLPFGGIRIEDDLHVTSFGTIDNLTRAFLPIGGGLA